MINRIYRLTGVRQIEIFQRELEMSGENVLVCPTYLSICAADQRYYSGRRKKEILKQRLPMALIHEGIGRIVYDAKKEYKVGTMVVMVPNLPISKEGIIKENYMEDAQFMSSNCDGFMQDIISMNRERLIQIPSNEKIYALSEIMSVAINAVESEVIEPKNKQYKIGIWGDGCIGFVTALVAAQLYPNAQIYVFGKYVKKLQYFSFASKTFLIDEAPEDIQFDYCFECVGGEGSMSAIEQIISMIRPQGTIVLLGVSENPVSINTRMVLEKGLRIIGSSRSGKKDFEKAVKMINEDIRVRSYLNSIISKIVKVENKEDIYRAFEIDCINDFKTIMEWKV